MRKRSLPTPCFILPLLLAAASSASAQSTPATPSTERTTRAFYQEMGGASLAKAGAAGVLFGVLVANPQLSDFQPVVQDWYTKYLSDRELESDVARMYGKLFSEQEMRDLTAFYRTPLGRKLQKSLPDIFKETLIISVRHTQGHGPELEDQLGRAVRNQVQEDELDGED